MRMRAGVVLFAMAGAAAVALVLLGVGRGWRLGLFLPFIAAASAVIQARDHT